MLNGAAPSIASEVAALAQELRTTESAAGTALQQATSPEQAADTFGLMYERYAGPPQPVRASHARAIYGRHLGSTPVSDTASVAACGVSAAGASGTAAAVIAEAVKWFGTPYSWGGGTLDGPSVGFAQGAGTVGFDCSSYTRYAFFHGTGLLLPRTAADQFAATAVHTVETGSPDLSLLQPETCCAGGPRQAASTTWRCTSETARWSRRRTPAPSPASTRCTTETSTQRPGRWPDERSKRNEQHDVEPGTIAELELARTCQPGGLTTHGSRATRRTYRPDHTLRSTIMTALAAASLDHGIGRFLLSPGFGGAAALVGGALAYHAAIRKVLADQETARLATTRKRRKRSYAALESAVDYAMNLDASILEFNLEGVEYYLDQALAQIARYCPADVRRAASMYVSVVERDTRKRSKAYKKNPPPPPPQGAKYVPKHALSTEIWFRKRRFDRLMGIDLGYRKRPPFAATRRVGRRVASMAPLLVLLFAVTQPQHALEAARWMHTHILQVRSLVIGYWYKIGDLTPH